MSACLASGCSGAAVWLLLGLLFVRGIDFSYDGFGVIVKIQAQGISAVGMMDEEIGHTLEEWKKSTNLGNHRGMLHAACCMLQCAVMWTMSLRHLKDT